VGGVDAEVAGVGGGGWRPSAAAAWGEGPAARGGDLVVGRKCSRAASPHQLLLHVLLEVVLLVLLHAALDHATCPAGGGAAATPLVHTTCMHDKVSV